VRRARRLEQQHIALCPDGEREEIRQLFARKGLAGSALDELVEAITRDEVRWVDTMLTRSAGCGSSHPPAERGAVTFGCFCWPE
jgi:hypothetical protein